MIPDTILLHHSTTADSRTLSWQAMRAYHMSWRCEGVAINPAHVRQLIGQGAPLVRPWDDIGYHFGIERVGDHFEALIGRVPNQIGAHCPEYGMNRRSIGICLIGDFDSAAPPPEQWTLAVRLVGALTEVLRIPVARVFGHREVAPGKSCPGRLFDLQAFRLELSNLGEKR